MLRNNVTRRKFLQGIAVTGLGAVSAQILAACAAPGAAPGSAPSTTGDTTTPATQVQLKLQVAPGAQAVMPEVIGGRFQADTGVEVVLEETIYGEIETKTQTGFISGTLQDILYGHHRWLFINYIKGIYLEIDDLLASNPPEDYDDIYPSVMAGNSVDGKNFSIPGVVHPGGNIAVNYNITMLEEKGLPLPHDGWTLADWTDLARAAAEPENGIFGMDFDNLSAMHYYSNVSRCFGAPDSIDSWMMDGEGTQINFNTPLHEEIAAWYLDLLDSRVAPRAADRIDTGLFVNGLVATHASIVGNVTNFIDQVDGRFEMDAALLPVGPDGRQGTCYSGNQHMINSATNHPEESWELMKLFAGGEAGIIMVLEGKLQPNGARAAWVDTQVNEVNHMFGVTDSLLTAGIEPFPMPRNTRFTEANNIFQNELEAVWEGSESWASQASIIEQRVQEVLDLDRPE